MRCCSITVHSFSEKQIRRNRKINLIQIYTVLVQHSACLTRTIPGMDLVPALQSATYPSTSTVGTTSLRFLLKLLMRFMSSCVNSKSNSWKKKKWSWEFIPCNMSSMIRFVNSASRNQHHQGFSHSSWRSPCLVACLAFRGFAVLTTLGTTGWQGSLFLVTPSLARWPHLTRWYHMCVCIMMVSCMYGTLKVVTTREACQPQWFLYIPLKVSEMALPFTWSCKPQEMHSLLGWRTRN